jgi:hypothetical protein
MNLQKSLKKTTELKEKASLIWLHYVNRKLKSPLEPTWTHAAYELIRQYALESVSKENMQLIKEIIMSHEFDDGTEIQAFPGIPNSPTRIIHDGWKIGTPTWVFMGRNESPQNSKYLGENWVAVRREIPADLYKFFDRSLPNEAWIAYNLNDQMGMSAMTANCVGPSCYLDDLIQALEQQIHKKLPANPVL